MAQFFTGSGYGVSDLTDLSGKPLLTYQGPNDKQPIILTDRVAVVKDPTVKQTWTKDELYNQRMDQATSAAIKHVVGGTSSQELDHKIPLELGGSNIITNLRLEDHVQGTQNTPTDPFENALAEKVMNGEISLQFAWETMAYKKGYQLTESGTQQPSFTFAEQTAVILAAIGKAATTKAPEFSREESAAVRAQVAENLAILKQNPYDLNARKKYFDAQIQAIVQTSPMTADEAAKTYLVTLTAYVSAKGNNPKTVADALTNDQNALIRASVGTNGLLQLPIDKIYWTLSRAVIGAPFIVAASVIALIVMVAYGGPELAAVVSKLPAIGEVIAIFRVSVPAGIVAGLGVAATAIVGVALVFNMLIKEFYDTQILSPSQNVQGFKDAVAAAKSSGVSFGSGGGSPSGGGSAPYGGGGGTVLITPVSSGVIGSAAAFTPRPLDIIESATDLTNAAQNNLSAYLTALPGTLGYDIKLASHVILDDGSIKIGGKNRVIKGYSKKGKPEYKTVTNKFAILEIYYVPAPRKRVILDRITLGPIDETTYAPNQEEIGNIVAHLQSNFVVSGANTDTQGMPATTTTPVLQDQEVNPTTQATTSTATANAPAIPSATQQPACQATDLYDWYQAQGLSLPNHITLAGLYERAQLGTATTYAGTAEQNTKLLQYLKTQAGCFISPAPTGTTASTTAPITPPETLPTATTLTPTAQQLYNRLHPIPVQVLYPTTGMFIGLNEFGQNIYRRLDNKIYYVNLLGPQFAYLYPGVVGAGAQAAIVQKYIKDNYGIDVLSLPQFNIADLYDDRTLIRSGKAGPDGGPDPILWPVDNLATFFTMASQTPAGSTTATING